MPHGQGIYKYPAEGICWICGGPLEDVYTQTLHFVIHNGIRCASVECRRARMFADLDNGTLYGDSRENPVGLLSKT